ncbi:DUF5994 family protein [Streptomyces sp. NPDC101152]|uniref:DUF5994 family protein n=1 Tax=Streptomyces sp. NPDC101152 TaxID=3366116 RepID=UPI0037F5E54C
MEPSRTPAEDLPADGGHTYRMPLPRLALTPAVSHGPLDGAWWPRCDALELELPSLVTALEPGRYTTVGVTVDAAQWPDAPHTVMAPGRVITVEPARSAGEEHVITLDCETVGRWVLLVVLPQEPADEAFRLMSAAADPTLHLGASALLAR